MRLDVKPMSVNKAYSGRRKKTKFYEAYTQEILLKLKKQIIPDGDLAIHFIFGFSNYAESDADNPVKPTQDIIAKGYGFNDKRIVYVTARKVKTKKGHEFIDFRIEKDKGTNNQQEAEQE